ncbi:MAG: hypothetical protein MOB07_25425 [Acidobacteria bacterium]|nr:hypothetical protein [Acidobacteriota bacterium]
MTPLTSAGLPVTDGFTEGNPKSVEITNDEFPHPIEAVVKPFPDFHPVLQALEESIDVLGIDVQIDLTAILVARPCPPALNMILPSPKDSSAQTISPSSSPVLITRKPIDSYQSTAARTSGTWIIGVTLCSMLFPFSSLRQGPLNVCSTPNLTSRAI